MKQAAKLRAKYKGLKMPDAIQLATAKYISCKEFITNDKQLKNVEEMKVLF
jgi:predicted nucleic acid-binding protein